MTYVADYWIRFRDGRIEVKDVKGCGSYVDPIARIKRKLMYYYYPDLDYQWICYYKGQWTNWDQVMKSKKKSKKSAKGKKG